MPFLEDLTDEEKFPTDQLILLTKFKNHNRDILNQIKNSDEYLLHTQKQNRLFTSMTEPLINYLGIPMSLLWGLSYFLETIKFISAAVFTGIGFGIGALSLFLVIVITIKNNHSYKNKDRQLHNDIADALYRKTIYEELIRRKGANNFQEFDIPSMNLEKNPIALNDKKENRIKKIFRRTSKYAKSMGFTLVILTDIIVPIAYFSCAAAISAAIMSQPYLIGLIIISVLAYAAFHAVQLSIEGRQKRVKTDFLGSIKKEISELKDKWFLFHKHKKQEQLETDITTPIKKKARKTSIEDSTETASSESSMSSESTTDFSLFLNDETVPTITP